MYCLSKKQEELFMKTRKVIFSCQNIDHIDTAAQMVHAFYVEIHRPTLKSFFCSHIMEKAHDSLNGYLKRRRIEIQYKDDERRNPVAEKFMFASQVCIP